MTQIDTSSPPPTTPPAFGPDPTSDPADPPTIYIIRILLQPPTDSELLKMMVIEWVESKGHDRAHAIAFVKHLNDQRMILSSIQRLLMTIDDLPADVSQALVVELVTDGAFTRRELKEPERIAAFFARPDCTEILTAWRESRLPTIGQVIQVMETERRRRSKQVAAPPQASSGSGRGTRDCLVGQLKALLPRCLRTYATDLAEAIRALASDPIVGMNSEALAAAVKRRRVGTGTKICHNTITAGLPHLVQHGYVIVEDGKARIRPGALV